MNSTPEHFDAVIVGSGFGGSVMAYRLAEAGKRVCLLERGRAFPPGSFPRGPYGFRNNFWDPSEGQLGMFNVWSFRGLESVTSSGLGGGSLIYANVLIRKDPEWFETEGWRGGVYERWPVSYDDLEKHYEAVERMMKATPYPLHRAPYDQTAKTLAFRDAAKRLELAWSLPNLAITFGNDPTSPRPGELIQEPRGNLHGKDNRFTCRLCGECDVGCNSGSKNTLDFNYLTEAQRRGAEIRTLCEVRSFRPRLVGRGGFIVEYVQHDLAREGRKTDTQRLALETLTADRLVVAAGTFGSTYLLMKNAVAFGGLSKALGTRFSGNGDFLAFAYRCMREEARGGLAPVNLDASRSPVITSTIRMPDAADPGGGRGFYLQDAGYPEWVNWVVETLQAPGALRRGARFVARRVESLLGLPDSDIGAELAELLGDCGASAGSMPLLGMGRDSPDGTMRLRRTLRGGTLLELDWNDESSRAYFARLRQTAEQVSRTMGGRFLETPLAKYFNRFVTVHPLGGCPMGRSANEGVVDDHGEVFNVPGLYVADGSVMPGPVGPNPSLTIAALSDRSADALIAGLEAGRRARPASSAARRRTRAPPLSVEFTEDMKGFFKAGEEDPATGESLGRAEGTALAFRLTIRIEDVEGFESDPEHEGRARGFVQCEALGGRLPVTDGRFHLFTLPHDGPRRGSVREMQYVLPFRSTTGEAFVLEGVKHAKDDPGLDVWPDLTTLYVDLFRLEDGAKRRYGAGVLHILVPDFLRQLTTLRALGAGGPVEYAEAVGRFGRFFMGRVWDVYGKPKVHALATRHH